jgi:hypothetical protein
MTWMRNAAVKTAPSRRRSTLAAAATMTVHAPIITRLRRLIGCRRLSIMPRRPPSSAADDDGINANQ